MSACSSLVIVIKDKNSRIVQFSHLSVKEFLMANRLAEPIRDVSRYHIRLEAAHTILAEACLGVLLRLDNHVDRSKIENFPLARYAAQYWVTHVRSGNASARIKDGMECLFDADRPHFVTWLWVYNEDRGGPIMSSVRPEKPEAAPLYYATFLGFRDLAEHLIAKHPEHINARGGREVTPMHVAALVGHADHLSLLLDCGAGVDGRGTFVWTPLHRASWNGELEAGKCLLDRGADVDARDEDGWTPLFQAVFHGHLEFARMLLKRGARVNAHDSSRGRTPLHCAVGSRNIQAVQLLLEHGADVNVFDKLGWTSSWSASALCDHEIMKLLSKYGAKSVK